MVLDTEQRQMTRSSFWIIFGIGIYVFASLCSPILVGNLFGHKEGFFTSILVAIIWLYLGFKMTMAPATRLIWIVGIAYIIFIVSSEFHHF